MPRTYAAKPDYAVKFWRSNHMGAPNVRVLDVVTKRAQHYFGCALPDADGYIACGDSRLIEFQGKAKIRWIITSPPYYGMRTYVPDQWLRNWFLGGPEKVAYKNANQLTHQSPESFAAQLGEVWASVARACADGARMVIRFGGIRDRRHDPRDILRESVRQSGGAWRLLTATSAGVATEGKRQANQFKRQLSAPIEECDFHVRLCG
jgi:hypothetical protein